MNHVTGCRVGMLSLQHNMRLNASHIVTSLPQNTQGVARNCIALQIFDSVALGVRANARHHPVTADRRWQHMRFGTQYMLKDIRFVACNALNEPCIDLQLDQHYAVAQELSCAACHAGVNTCEC